MSQWYTIFKRGHFLSSVLIEGLVNGHNSKWPQSDYCSWLFVENNIHSSFLFSSFCFQAKSIFCLFTRHKDISFEGHSSSHMTAWCFWEDCKMAIKRSRMLCCFYWQSDTHIVYCSLTHQALNILSFEILLCKQKHSMCFGYGCPLSVLLSVCFVELL